MEITIDNIQIILEQLVGRDNLDLSDLTWIEPIGLSLLKAIKDSTGVPIILPRNSSVLNYLDVMNLDEDHLAYSGNTYVPLHVLSNTSEIDRTAQKTAEKILLNEDFSGLPNEDANDFKDYLKYTISEMLNNALEHSGVSGGVVSCAQYFPRKRKTQVAIVDTGVGFFRTISRNYPQVQNETEALGLSLKAGITGDQTRLYEGVQRHAGYGLYVLSKIVEETEGLLVMVSNNGMLIFKNGCTTLTTLSTQWRGSIVAFDINESKINHSLDEFFKIYIWSKQMPETDDLIF